jgi:hypothetical protein
MDVEVPRVGQTASRSRLVTGHDIALFTEISGDRNPLHYRATQQSSPARTVEIGHRQQPHPRSSSSCCSGYATTTSVNDHQLREECGR